MLLSDLGTQTADRDARAQSPQAALAWYQQATDALLQWQKASRPGVLPAYDEALLRRELTLFPDWYLASTGAWCWTDKQQAVLGQRLQPHRGAQPGRAQRVCAPRLHDPQPDGAAADPAAAGGARLPGRRLRPHHLRHRQPAARRLHQLGCRISSSTLPCVTRKRPARPGWWAPTAPAAGAPTSASSTARWSGWACSAT